MKTEPTTTECIRATTAPPTPPLPATARDTLISRAIPQGRPVHLVALGGTIACTKRNGRDVPTLRAEDLLRLAGLSSREIGTSDPMRVDSAELTPSQVVSLANLLRQIAEARGCGILLTMGTDTLVETSCRLQRLLADIAASIPVAITGSMRTSQDPDWDGAPNLRDAFSVAAGAPPGVYIAFGGRILEPSRTVKTSATEPDGIRGVGKSELGRRISDGTVRLVRCPRHLRPEAGRIDVRPDAVVRFTLHQDASARQLEGLLSAQPQACVIEAFGDANFPVAGSRGAAFLRTIEREIHLRGTLFVVVSQVAFGSTDCAYPGGQLLQECGVVSRQHLVGFAAAAARSSVATAIASSHSGRRRAWDSDLPGDVQIQDLAVPLTLDDRTAAPLYRRRNLPKLQVSNS